MVPAEDKFDLLGHRPTWAEIDLDALAHNFNVVKRLVGPDVEVMPAVKANAYGHGAVECARRLAQESAAWFGVATPEEGIELRKAGVTQPILCMGGFWPGQAELCLQHKLTLVVYRLEMIEAVECAAKAIGTIADVHVKIDTGMGRLGIRFDAVPEFVDHMKGLANVRVDGLMTHFAAADDLEREVFTGAQLSSFNQAVEMFRARGFAPRYRHLANSAGIFGHPDSWGNMVRPGGVLYGLWRDVLPVTSDAPDLKPVMSLRTRITHLKTVPAGETVGYGCTFMTSRDTRVATLPLGYNDGYPRQLSNRGQVIVRGQLAAVIGRVSMDLTLVDVTDVAGVAVGDEVTLLGRSSELLLPAEEIAKAIGTLSYEITCGVSYRVPRVSTNNNPSEELAADTRG